MPRNVKAELKITGDITRPDIARLKKQIEFLEESYDDEIKEKLRILKHAKGRHQKAAIAELGHYQIWRVFNPNLVFWKHRE